MLHSMTSIELEDGTAAALRSAADRAGLSVDAYVRRLQVGESARDHAAWHQTHPGVLDDELAEAAAAQAEIA